MTDNGVAALTWAAAAFALAGLVETGDAGVYFTSVSTSLFIVCLAAGGWRNVAHLWAVIRRAVRR